MAGLRIRTVDTDGNKGLLPKTEFGYDDYSAGGDAGRVYVGTGTVNKALAFKEEVDSKLPATADIQVALNANTLTITDIHGSAHNIDLSVYLDDSNLSRIVNGTLDAATGVATFSRDDASTFTLDLSSLIDTNVTVLDNLTSTNATAALSANQGKILNDKIVDLTTSLTTVTEW